ncbi:Aste57867_8456 [Aphanomyces stellatus]|uniref:Aste57867_8456 protein n=1 Tax=Aphanomyces stellatus TaxID=120398 RepID=A0A485KKD1_9STRA|nr:hypothetical protein As57867_008424 [Aphanomyces stellatus]VFT85342.1 Aste57867_8456 [Aphanomyces stellatus]
MLPSRKWQGTSKARQLGSRGQSIATLQLKILLFRSVLSLALVKHTISSLYFTLMCFLYLTTSTDNLHAVQAYAPNDIGILMGYFRALHTYGLSRSCRVHATRFRIWFMLWTALDSLVSPATQVTLAHFVNVLCQSYQVYHISHYLVDPGLALCFVVVVSLNCIITPWCACPDVPCVALPPRKFRLRSHTCALQVALPRESTSMPPGPLLPIKVRQLGARSHSLTTLELKRVLDRPVRGLALVKHFVSALYFGILSFLYLTTSAADMRAIQAFVPDAMGIVMGCFAVFHVYGIVRVCRVHVTRSRFWTARRGVLHRFLSPATQLTLFHFLDVVCQSYQACHMSYYVVDPSHTLGFVVVVSLNCCMTPWFLLSKHKVVRQSVVPLVESIFGFVVSTLFQMVVFIYPAMLYTFNAPYVQSPHFTTRLVLVSRCVIVSSPLDLVTKIVLQFSSFTSLRLLVESQHMPHRRISETSPTRVATHFQFEFHHNRHHFGYVACMCVWGIYILSVATVAIWHSRSMCPDTCQLAFAPWWTSTCSCAFVAINCARENITGESVDSFLDPEILGDALFFIESRRCALPKGIRLATLAPFQHLYGLHIEFSNMTEWPVDDNHLSTTFPDSLREFAIRYSHLMAVPAVLVSGPTNLEYLVLEGAFISTIPDDYVESWANISLLALNALNLTSIPFVASAGLANLQWLQLRGNYITSIPPQWKPSLVQLNQIDLSANALQDAPWRLANGDTASLDLSSNPIAAVPSNVDPRLLASRAIVLDDTPYCAAGGATCQPKCARLCETTFIANGRCDWACYSAACDFDGGDCDDVGMTFLLCQTATCP